jgi:hypothetical protein
LNPRFLSETNTRVPLREILAVRDRIDPADKFLSLLFRHRLDALLQTVELFHCENCLKIMT